MTGEHQCVMHRIDDEVIAYLCFGCGATETFDDLEAEVLRRALLLAVQREADSSSESLG